MVAIPRQELEEWVQSWLQANKDCEKAGNWKPLADFYAPDATYGWNIGPKEDVMCLGIDEIRDIAMGLEMEGLENWKYPYQKVIIDDKQGEVVGFWKQVVVDDGRQRAGDLWHRRQLDPTQRGQADRVAARLLRLRPRSGAVPGSDEGRQALRGHAEADRAQPGRREAPRLLPAGPRHRVPIW